MTALIASYIPALIGSRVPYPPPVAEGMLPKCLPNALAEFAAQNNLTAFWSAETFSVMENCVLEVKRTYDTMPAEDRQQVRDRIISNGGLSLLPGARFPSFVDVRLPFPSSQTALQPVTFPPFPPIQIPSTPGVNGTTLAANVGNRVTGLVGGVLQTVRDVIAQLPIEAVQVIDKFVDRITTVGELVKSGQLDKAIASLVESVALLARDVVAVALATIVNLVVDIVAGIVGGLFLSRALTASERDFAHAIFHDRINLTFLRVVVLGGTSGLTSANVIYVPSLNLDRFLDRGLFAHELCHVYQDQTLFDPATLHASYEFLNHYYGSGRNPYRVTLSSQSTWNGLGVEQQAQVVQNWQNHLDIIGLFNGENDPIPANERQFYQNVVTSEGLF